MKDIAQEGRVTYQMRFVNNESRRKVEVAVICHIKAFLPYKSIRSKLVYG